MRQTALTTPRTSCSRLDRRARRKGSSSRTRTWRTSSSGPCASSERPGPTETTIASSYYTVPRCPDDDRAAIPIGTACEGEELLVLDDHLRSTRPGEAGDLYIGGVGLSPGYWRDAARTDAAFIADPRRD